MTQKANTTFREEIRRDWNCGMNTTKTHGGSGQSFEVRGEAVSRLTICSRPFVDCFYWPAAERAQAWCQRCGTNRSGKEFGLFGSVG